MVAATSGSSRLVRLYVLFPGWVWVILLWSALALPFVDLPAFRWEEGKRALLALDLLREGHWAAPALLGGPYFDKPPLLAWLIAAAAQITGGVNEWAVRLPAILALLGGGLIVRAFLRPRTGPLSATFGAAAFLLSPLILEKARVGETDVLVTVLAFAAFVVWWGGHEAGRLDVRRATTAGLLLALAALGKGPAPVGYPILAAIILTILARRHRDWPMLALMIAVPAAALLGWVALAYTPGAGQAWLAEMRLDRGARSIGDYLTGRGDVLGRLALGLLPWLLIALPAIVGRWRKRLGIDRELARAMVVYAAAGSLIILLVDDARPRYMMPSVPAVAVLAALGVRALWARRRWLDRVIAGLCLLPLVVHLFMIGVYLPLNRDEFDDTKVAGRALNQVIAARSVPVYLMFERRRPNYNLFAYIDRPVQRVSRDEADRLAPPFWLIVGADPIEEPPTQGAVATTVTDPQRRHYTLILAAE